MTLIFPVKYLSGYTRDVKNNSIFPVKYLKSHDTRRTRWLQYFQWNIQVVIRHNSEERKYQHTLDEIEG